MRKRVPVIVGRDENLAKAVDLVRAGISVDVVGSRGSGRSAFLDSLCERLVHIGWNVISIRGIASLQQHALSAMHLAGIGSGSRGVNTLHDVSESLRAAVSQGKSAIFLDDWDDLDEASWGLVEFVRRAEGVPVVLSRLLGLRARHTPSGLEASSREPSFVIDMEPLRFVEMDQVLSDYLGGQIDSGTSRRIYAKTGGNIGLGIGLVDATTREGKLTLRDGEWVGYRDLWSSSLRSMLEGYLENLEPNTRDALEIIAIVGFASLDTVRKLVDWGTLELLEERSMIKFIESGSTQLVAVVPPMLVEYFRHEPLSARRVRLNELIVERLGSRTSSSSLVTHEWARPESTPEGEALFVRLLHERARALRMVTAAEWEESPTPTNAIRYVEALSLFFTHEVRGTVKRVFTHTDEASAPDNEFAQMLAFKARWYANVDRDVPLALSLLRDAHRNLGSYERILDAAEIEIRFTGDRLPENFAEKLEVSDDLPDSVKTELLRVQQLLFVSTGRLSDAFRAYAELELFGAVGINGRMLHALALLGKGDHSSAIEKLSQWLDESHSYLDIEGVRLFSEALVVAHIVSGGSGPIAEIMVTVFSAGEPSPLNSTNQISLLSLGALVSLRQGRVATAERLLADLANTGLHDGPLPGQSAAWGTAQSHVFNGRVNEGVACLWESAEHLWERGARFAAFSGYIAAIELAPTREKIETVRSRLSTVTGLNVFQPHLAYYTALCDRDVPGMVTVAHECFESDRIGLALCAYQEIAKLEESTENSAVIQLARERISVIRELYPTAETATFATHTPLLTSRELEVAQLVVAGFTNNEIAHKLVLSVRTVETHIHRLFRKLDVRSRKELRASFQPGNSA